MGETGTVRILEKRWRVIMGYRYSNSVNVDKEGELHENGTDIIAE